MTARAVGNGRAVRELLVEQVTAPVKWAQTMAFLKAQDVTHVIEIGPGKVLSGLARREMRPEQALNLDTLQDINAFASVAV